MTAPLPTASQPSASRPLSARITDAWQHKGLLACALLPLSWIYASLGSLRRSLYRAGVLKTWRAPVPTVVVGNVIAGGAGKTPVTIHLVQALQAKGWRPAVISRGYGRDSSGGPAALEVTAHSDPREVGDEPLLIAQRTNAPVFVANKRAAAAQAALLAHKDINVLICDDGLQHLALARDLEIAVFNRQGVGNGWQLPAGPLREPWPRPLDIALFADEPPARLAHSGAAAWQVVRQLADFAIAKNGHHIPLVSLRGRRIHAVVVHLGLVHGSRLRQTAQIQQFIKEYVPDDEPVVVAGDFNDWGFQVKSMLAGFGLFEYDEQPLMTYPSRLPVVQLDHVYARGLTPCGLFVPRGRIWWRMSDHLPLIAEFRLRD